MYLWTRGHRGFDWTRPAEVECSYPRSCAGYLFNAWLHQSNQNVRASNHSHFEYPGPKRTRITHFTAIFQGHHVVKWTRYLPQYLKRTPCLTVVADVPTIWSPTVSFIIFAVVDKVKGTNNLTAAKAFTALSIITLVTEPASKLLAAMPQIAAALRCFQRLQDYMLSESFEDTRRSGTQADEHPLPSSTGSREQGKSASSNITEHDSLSRNAIEFKKATFLPTPKAESAVLSDVSVTIKSESIAFVLGPIGSGKTTLLKAILGELPCASGSIHVSSKDMSFCSQTPWLLNTTVRKNICGLGDEAIDVEWYESVLHSCALHQDMQQWPEGDRSIVGSKGFMLSGGQKQRVVSCHSQCLTWSI